MMVLLLAGGVRKEAEYEQRKKNNRELVEIVWVNIYHHFIENGLESKFRL